MAALALANAVYSLLPESLQEKDYLFFSFLILIGPGNHPGFQASAPSPSYQECPRLWTAPRARAIHFSRHRRHSSIFRRPIEWNCRRHLWHPDWLIHDPAGPSAEITTGAGLIAWAQRTYWSAVFAALPAGATVLCLRG